jgi:undecaprenyl pyrophosphate phosphatase UppP
MFSLAFIVIVTCICVFISYSISEDVTWFDYYRGGVIGLFISAVILQIWNNIKRKQEMKNKKSIYEK